MWDYLRTKLCQNPDGYTRHVDSGENLTFIQIGWGARGSVVVKALFFLLLFGLWGYWHCGHSWPIVPASGDGEDDCGEADEM
jgi:hypothetical protein